VSGLEWDTVFLVQCNEMVMPLQRPSMAKLPVADSFDQTKRKERINRKKNKNTHSSPFVSVRLGRACKWPMNSWKKSDGHLDQESEFCSVLMVVH
jgi:superfamily I DNA/RNA helicase